MKFSLKQTIGDAFQAGQAGLGAASNYLGASLGYFQDTLRGTWFFGSTERIANTDDQPADEKHYFLTPYRLSQRGYSLYSMRCLPEGVPPINDLPKRRTIHLPNSAALEVVEQILTDQAVEQVSGERPEGLGTRLNGLADQIDQLDGQVFNGMLAIGGLVALVNPVAGAAIAAKSLIPSAAMIVSKFGLRTAGDSLNDRNVKSQIAKAERDVKKQFKQAQADSLVNPILAALDRALETDESQYDPLLEVDFEAVDYGARDRRRLLDLTFRAVSNVYADVLNDRARWPPAQLGPEDVRWLETIRECCE